METHAGDNTAGDGVYKLMEKRVRMRAQKDKVEKKVVP